MQLGGSPELERGQGRGSCLLGTEVTGRSDFGGKYHPDSLRRGVTVRSRDRPGRGARARGTRLGARVLGRRSGGFWKRRPCGSAGRGERHALPREGGPRLTRRRPASPQLGRKNSLCPPERLPTGTSVSSRRAGGVTPAGALGLQLPAAASEGSVSVVRAPTAYKDKGVHLSGRRCRLRLSVHMPLRLCLCVCVYFCVHLSPIARAVGIDRHLQLHQ